MLTGGCACRNVRYECMEEPIVQLMCHCRDCQRSTGTAFSAMMMVASDKFNYVHGLPTFYETIAESGRPIRRGFCGKCGSPISAHWPTRPQLLIVAVGSLDDPSLFGPTAETWLSRAWSWHPLHPRTAKFGEAPVEGVREKIEAYFAGRAEL
ncbi:GFA family protein [Bradyrhizobium diazoefficiens]|uniref:GFA family protein n=1 Tax=Bradyrhizobium diazoefficiens TaxID=1355477 RepID=UPI00190C753F|nr:GFA family protein [Bradyrhizobium diazoefficiens]QQO12559.1 GFA family protein [Bradyrhizobium diazoefficiens]